MIKSESSSAFSDRFNNGINEAVATVRLEGAPTRRSLMNMMVSATALTAASAVGISATANAGDCEILSLASPMPSKAALLWAERQTLVARSNRLYQEWQVAHEKLPAWAKPGPRNIDSDGTHCGDEVGWPLDVSVSPPDRPGVYRICRLSPKEIRENFDFAVRTFAKSDVGRAQARARMRDSMRKLIARVRIQRKEWSKAGLNDLDRQIDAVSNERFDIEMSIEQKYKSADAKAASIFISLQDNCLQTDTAEDNSEINLACIAIELLQPRLTGLIADHAAFFLSNRTTALGVMPFALV
jgi:hypothetical protein